MVSTESEKTGAIDTNKPDGCYASHPDRDIEIAEMALNDAEGTHDTSSLTSTLCSDLTAVDQKSVLFSDTGSDFLGINSATPSRICSMPVKLGEEYLYIARRLLMAKITDRYGVLFPFWVCECTTVPRDSSGGGKSKPHPSQYYPLLQQHKEWKEWQEMNPNEIDPGGEISLHAIEWHSEDPDDKPPFHLWYLILAAIHGSPIKRMTENEIKLCLIRRFCYFASRQGSTRDGSAWITDVSNELEQNRLFNSLSMCKEDRDDPNYYWTIAHLPLEGIIFHPRNQTLDSAGCYRTLSTSLLMQLHLHLQGRPVSESQHSIVYTIKGAAAHNRDSSKWRDVSGDGSPKIPISMLMHPVNIDPLNQRIIEINVHNVESWHWIPS